MQVTTMGRVLFLASVATILLIGNADGLAAQGRGGAGATGGASVGAHGAAMAAPRASGRVTSSPGSHLAIPRSPSGQILPRRAGTTVRATGRYGGSTTARTRQFSSTRGLDFSQDSNVPGLGFDAVHVAATRGNRAGVGRDRDHDRGRRNEFGVLFPFFDGGGYYVPTGPDISGDVQGDGQALDDAEDQGPGPDDRPYPYDRAPRSANRPPTEQPGPQSNVPEYVFVRRDGTVFFAVAYSWDQGSLRYISSEGTRRSVSRDTLDLKATEEFNEQRGLTFRSPA
jgi:hypothetical protein